MKMLMANSDQWDKFSIDCHVNNTKYLNWLTRTDAFSYILIWWSLVLFGDLGNEFCTYHGCKRNSNFCEVNQNILAPLY